jgi:hypothetical protein
MDGLVMKMPESSAEIIGDFENQIRQNDFIIRGVSYWPIYRFLIGINANQRPRLRGSVKKNRVRDLFVSGIRDLFRMALYKEKDNVLFFSVNSGRQKLLNRQYDPYGDVFKSLLLPELNIKVANRWNSNSIEVNQAYFDRVEIDQRWLYSIISIARKLSLCFNLRLEKSTERFLEISEHIGIGKALISAVLKDLPYRVHTVRVFRAFYSLVFALLRPKVVVVNCYYSWDSLGIVAAAKKWKIPVFDRQHGIQNSGHYGYDEWRTVRLRTEEFLPDGFLLWDNASKKKFEQWFDVDRLYVIGKGETQFIENYGPNFHEQILKLRKIATDRRIILFTLQDHLPPTWFISFICQSSFFWMFRLHPQYPSLREKIGEALLCTDAWDIDLTNELPLPIAMSACDIHITIDSTTAIEAVWSGTPSIVIGGRSEQYFAREIHNGSIFLAGSQRQLTEALVKEPSVNSSPISYNSEIQRFIHFCNSQ